MIKRTCEFLSSFKKRLFSCRLLGNLLGELSVFCSKEKPVVQIKLTFGGCRLNTHDFLIGHQTELPSPSPSVV